MPETATFVLVAGALQPAWVWNRVSPLLRAAGFAVVAEDLPAMGDNQSVHPDDVTLPLWADFITNLAQTAESPVILVGHSRAGIIVGEVAERIPHLVRGLIYVSGIAVPPGRTGFDVMALDPNAPSPPMTASKKAFYLPAEIVIPLMYHRCSNEDQNEVASRLSPEPFAPLMTQVTVTQERWGTVPRAYVETSDDQTLSLPRQRIIQSEAGCSEIATIDADHSPFLSAATELADILVLIASKFLA